MSYNCSNSEDIWETDMTEGVRFSYFAMLVYLVKLFEEMSSAHTIIAG